MFSALTRRITTGLFTNNKGSLASFLKLFLLSKADSNHHKQNQNLLCYHYTIGHRCTFCGCKITKKMALHKIFANYFTVNRK